MKCCLLHRAVGSTSPDVSKVLRKNLGSGSNYVPSEKAQPAILRNLQLGFRNDYILPRRSQWPRGLRRGSAAARLLGMLIRIPPGAWMSVSCDCCVFSGTGLCDDLITRPGESFWVWCVWMWSWILDNEEALAHWGGGLLRHSKEFYLSMITFYRIRSDKTVPVNEHHAMKVWPRSVKYDGQTNIVLNICTRIPTHNIWRFSPSVHKTVQNPKVIFVLMQSIIRSVDPLRVSQCYS